MNQLQTQADQTRRGGRSTTTRIETLRGRFGRRPDYWQRRQIHHNKD